MDVLFYRDHIELSADLEIGADAIEKTLRTLADWFQWKRECRQALKESNEWIITVRPKDPTGVGPTEIGQF